MATVDKAMDAGVVDLQAIFQEFLANPDQTTLALPWLSPEQRKEAKKLAASFENLTCESFGLAQERRVHLFKSAAPAAPAAQAAATRSATTLPVSDVLLSDPSSPSLPPPSLPLPKVASKEEKASSAYSVKNTFIDDYVSGCTSEPVVFRSIPVALGGSKLSFEPAPRFGSKNGSSVKVIEEGLPSNCTRTSSDSSGAADRSCPATTADKKKTRDLTVDVDVDVDLEVDGNLNFLKLTTGEVLDTAGWCSPGNSTCGSPSTGESTSSSARIPHHDNEGDSKAAGSSPLPKGFEVRNTFICGILEQENPDNRTVQSMPHGMFRQELLTEMQQSLVQACAAVASAPSLQPPAAPAPPHQPPFFQPPSSQFLPHAVPPPPLTSAVSVSASPCLLSTGATATLPGAGAGASTSASASVASAGASVAAAALALATASSSADPAASSSSPVGTATAAASASASAATLSTPGTGTYQQAGLGGTAADRQANFGALLPGTDVMIHSLAKCPIFNGLTGKVEGLDEETGRFKILLPTLVCGQRWAKVKAENLWILPPNQVPLQQAAAATSYSPLFTPGPEAQMMVCSAR